MDQLRSLQLVETDMLKKVASVCDQLGLVYFLNSGTLLGAVRHQGFIPWDDDIDLAMPFEDYMVFQEKAQGLLGDRFFVQSMKSDPNFNKSFMRVRLNGTTLMDSYHIHWNIHHGVWIDIFPLIPIMNKLDFKLKRIIISACNYIQMESLIVSHYEEFKKRLGKIGIFFLFLFYKIPERKRICLHESIIVNLGRKKNARFLSVLWGSITKMYPKEIFASSKEIEFEDGVFRAPIDTEKYLRMTYGDYMKLPPEEQRYGHSKDMIVDLENDYHKYLEL